MAKPHSLKYIKQLLEWGFDKEFIARDMGVNLASLEVRLNRAKKREQINGDKRPESETCSD